MVILGGGNFLWARYPCTEGLLDVNRRAPTNLNVIRWCGSSEKKERSPFIADQTQHDHRVQVQGYLAHEKTPPS